MLEKEKVLLTKAVVEVIGSERVENTVGKDRALTTGIVSFSHNT